jgi:hypothetical protein
MGDLFSGPHVLLILFILILIVGIPFMFYALGFRNGKREGERVQLQKQVDANRAKG